MLEPSPLVYREEERHRSLGRDATFSWSRALTHPPRCNRTRHRGRHLVSDFVGAAILDLTPRGPPSWIGSDVKNAKVTPILLAGLRLCCSQIPEDRFSRVAAHRQHLGAEQIFRSDSSFR